MWKFNVYLIHVDYKIVCIEDYWRFFWHCNTALIHLSKAPGFSVIISGKSENLLNNHHKKEEKETKGKPCKGTEEYWVTPATDMDQNQKGDSYWVTSETWTQTKCYMNWHYTRWVNIHSAAVFKVFQPISQCVYSTVCKTAVCLCVRLLAGNCFYVVINKRFKCWLCQHSLCF